MIVAAVYFSRWPLPVTRWKIDDAGTATQHSALGHDPTALPLDAFYRFSYKLERCFAFTETHLVSIISGVCQNTRHTSWTLPVSALRHASRNSTRRLNPSAG